jgi:hypothetical protein
MKITRKAAIQLIAGLAGVFGSQVKGQRPLATITPGHKTPESEAGYQKCLKDAEAARAKADPNSMVWGCFESMETAPGTTIIRLHLTELEAIEVILDGETRRVSQQELWGAL